MCIRDSLDDVFVFYSIVRFRIFSRKPSNVFSPGSTRLSDTQPHTIDAQIIVELKNNLAVSGVLVSVDQYLNIKLKDTKVVEEEQYPQLKSARNCFIRGSVVRYVQLPSDAIDVDLLHDATRREARGS